MKQIPIIMKFKYIDGARNMCFVVNKNTTSTTITCKCGDNTLNVGSVNAILVMQDVPEDKRSN